MSKMTLLEIVQNILSAMDSDEVNTISDTVESLQVAEVVKETFYELFDQRELPERKTIIQLGSLGDTTRPNYLNLPNDILEIDWIKYRNDASNNRYEDISYCEPEAFWLSVLQNISTHSNVTQVTDSSGIQYYVKNNKQPSFYTIMDDNHLIFDSFNSTYDAALQESKSFAWGTKSTSWQMSDTYIPPIDAAAFPLLLSESKSVCFINVKQSANQKEEQRSRRQAVKLQKKKFRDKKAREENWKGPNFARNR